MMLVLTRRKDQSVQIGDNIRIVVVEVRRDGYCRLGIEAPPDVRIMRGELLEKEHEQ